MALEITETSNDGVITLKLKGRLTVEESTRVCEKITQVAASGPRNLAMDFSEVDYLDSRGVGSLFSSLVSLKRRPGSIKIVNLAKGSKDIVF